MLNDEIEEKEEPPEEKEVDTIVPKARQADPLSEQTSMPGPLVHPPPQSAAGDRAIAKRPQIDPFSSNRAKAAMNPSSASDSTNNPGQWADATGQRPAKPGDCANNAGQQGNDPLNVVRHPVIVPGSTVDVPGPTVDVTGPTGVVPRHTVIVPGETRSLYPSLQSWCLSLWFLCQSLRTMYQGLWLCPSLQPLCPTQSSTGLTILGNQLTTLALPKKKSAANAYPKTADTLLTGQTAPIMKPKNKNIALDIKGIRIKKPM